MIIQWMPSPDPWWGDVPGRDEAPFSSLRCHCCCCVGVHSWFLSHLIVGSYLVSVLYARDLTVFTLGNGALATCSANTAVDWRFTAEDALSVAYAAVLTSALNYFLMAWVNNRSSPLTVTAFSPFQPVMTAILSWLALNEVRTLPLLMLDRNLNC